MGWVASDAGLKQPRSTSRSSPTNKCARLNAAVAPTAPTPMTMIERRSSTALASHFKPRSAGILSARRAREATRRALLDGISTKVEGLFMRVGKFFAAGMFAVTWNEANGLLAVRAVRDHLRARQRARLRLVLGGVHRCGA